MHIYTSDTDLADILAEAHGYEQEGNWRRARKCHEEYNFRTDVNHFIDVTKKLLAEKHAKETFDHRVA